MSRPCPNIGYFGFSIFILFFSWVKWKGNDNFVWLWPRAMTFVQSIVLDCCAFRLAMTEHWVVLICGPHAVILSWHSGFDKPLLSAVCLRWQEKSRSTARHQSSWTATARLQGLASACYPQLHRLFHVAEPEREWLCHFDLEPQISSCIWDWRLSFSCAHGEML